MANGLGPLLQCLGACEGCILRIGGCREPERYAAITVSKLPGAEEATAEGSCGLCFGFLERGAVFRAQLRSQLEKAAKGDRYELGVEVPALAVFRHFLLLAHLRGDGEDDDEPDCVELKQALRWVFGAELDSAIYGGGCLADVAGGEPVLVGALQAQATCSYSAPTPSLERLRVTKKQRTNSGAVPTGVIQDALGSLSRSAALAVVGGNSLEDHLRRVTSEVPASVHFELKRDSLYVRGRYLKLSREVPQSPWIVDGQRKGKSSVEELICAPMTSCFGASGCSFHGEGREDIDVRMLGSGRPFVVEVQNPRRSAGMEELELAVNAGDRRLVTVRRLRPCEPGDMARLQKDAEEHRKKYVCVCWSQRPLAQEDADGLTAKGELEIDQKTPVRVLHRRSLVSRPRSVYWMDAKLINAHYFRLRLAAQSGTYIKEFVHGDFGRTVPSLRSLLGSRVDILQLDVEGLDDSDGEAEVEPKQGEQATVAVSE